MIDAALTRGPSWLRTLAYHFESFRTFRSGKFRYQDFFPVFKTGRVLIGEEIRLKTPETYVAQYYREENVARALPSVFDYMAYKLEILPAKRKKAGTIHAIEVDQAPAALPLSLINERSPQRIGNEFKVNLGFGGVKRSFSNWAQNRFHYLRLDQPGRYEIDSDFDLSIGGLIPLNRRSNGKKRVVIAVFIDGLSAEVLSPKNAQDWFPHSSEFFAKGSQFRSSFSTGQWTFPSVASFFTGLYPLRHRMNNPSNETFLPEGYKTLPELFREQGYFTTQICSNQRKNPFHGYLRGFDRTLYKANLSCPDVVDLTIESLKSFAGRDQFIWMTLFDLHHLLNHLPDTQTQLEMSLEEHDYGFEEGVKSVDWGHDQKKIARYFRQVRFVDQSLSRLYQHIQAQYSEEEVLVLACSDHGQSYLSLDKDPLGSHRVHVPLLIYGAPQKGIQSELISGADIAPTLLHLSGLKIPQGLDGVVPKVFGGAGREFCLSELIYPGKNYYAVVHHEKGRLQVKSRHKIQDEKKVELGSDPERNWQPFSQTASADEVSRSLYEWVEKRFQE